MAAPDCARAGEAGQRHKETVTQARIAKRVGYRNIVDLFPYSTKKQRPVNSDSLSRCGAPILGGFPGSAVVSTASVGVPPAESFSEPATAIWVNGPVRR
jgi:hypothetical protein